MKWGFTGSLLALLAATAAGWPYDESLVDYNLNVNKDTTNPAEYTHAEWKGHKFHPSPKSWRFPFYTLFIDRFVNGDPTNDNINGSLFEHDLNSNQMRHGGDAAGLVDTLDYLQGMGIKVRDNVFRVVSCYRCIQYLADWPLQGIYLAGTILMNQPWGSDGYSILDTTLLDQHYGTIQTWRDAITEIHKRGMYVLFDNTIAT